MSESERPSNDPSQPGALDSTTRIAIGKTNPPGKAAATPPAEDGKRATGRLIGVERGDAAPKTDPGALNLTTRIVIGKSAAPAAGQEGIVPAIEESKRATGRLVGVGHMEPKSSTTRISLDAAPEAVAPPKPGTPRTVVLKKPPAPGETETPPVAVDLQKSKTAQIQLPPEADLGGSATRRKTIKIKRPTVPAGGVTVAARPVVIARPEQTTVEEAAAEATEEQPGVLYAIMALAAVLIAVAVIGVEIAMP